MDNISLRPCTLDDLPTLEAVIQAAFAEYEGMLDPPSGAHKETVDTLRPKVERGGALLALVDGQTAGCVVFYPGEGYLYLGRLAVLPAFRGLGIGRRLVAAVEDQARALNLSKVQLGARTALPRNRALFESLGYCWVQDGFHEGRSEATFVILEKTL